MHPGFPRTHIVTPELKISFNPARPLSARRAALRVLPAAASAASRISLTGPLPPALALNSDSVAHHTLGIRRTGCSPLSLCGAYSPNASVVARDGKRLRSASHYVQQILRALDLLDIISAIREGERGHLLLVCKVDDNQAEGAAKLP
jgi:hypothetical protein